MRVALLVLGVTLLCVSAAVAQVEAPRGRGRLRELVQKARSGDTEAKTILASRRRKIVRNKVAGGDIRRTNIREQSVVQSILGGAAPAPRSPRVQATSESRTPVHTRLPVRSRQRAETSRSRARGGSSFAHIDVTTFRPRFTPKLATTEAPTPSPVELSPVPVVNNFVTTSTAFEPPHVDLRLTSSVPSMFQPAQFGSGGRGVQAFSTITREPPRPQPTARPAPRPRPQTSAPVVRAPVGPPHVDLTPTNTVPSMFQSAQFGSGGRGAPAVDAIRRLATRTESRQRSRTPTEPHRSVQRGLETGSRSEVSRAKPDANQQPTPRPIQTTRRYSYYDDVGNYVFGYEDEDGTFKEEIRGLDCIVNGKYGYVDPTGIRREFTYVSGNKCDPSNPDVNLPNNGADQFLHQTQETALTETELSALVVSRRRKPVQSATQDRTVSQRTSSSRNRASRPQIRTTPKPPRFTPEPPRFVPEPPRFAPELPRFVPEPPRFAPKPAVAARPVDLTPTNVIPSMFQPAQFGGQQRAKPQAPAQDRFPVPDFLGSTPPRPRTRPSSRPQESSRRQEASRRQSPRKEVRPAPEIRKPRPEAPPHVDLTPSHVIPSMFQPAQFGTGGRGVQAQTAVTRAPQNFNFEEEFRSVFSHFDSVGAPRSVARPAPRPTTPRPPRPPPTQRPITRAPVTRPPPPPPSAVPSLFQPAQFGGQQPARPAPAPIPFEDNSLTLPSQASAGHQLVFDASTGTFKTVQLGSAPPPRPTQPPHRPPPPPRPTHAPFPTAAPRQSFTSQTTGRPLFGSGNGRNPLPSIPTSQAEFDHFFAQFASSG